MIRFLIVLLLSILATLGLRPSVVSAHQLSTSYLTLEASPDRINVTWELAVSDLHLVWGLDSDANGEISWGEVAAIETTLVAESAKEIEISGADGACQLQNPRPLQIRNRNGQVYIVFGWDAECRPTNQGIQLTYRFLEGVDDSHSAFLTIKTSEGGRIDEVRGSGTKWHGLPAKGGSSSFGSFVWHGVVHILIGYDHLAFLLTLLLPAVIGRGGHDPRVSFAGVLRTVALVVTAFTLAHSITLGLAATKVITLPSQPVEIAIAASIVVAALLNFGATARNASGWVAFVFGLLHGFGFASVLLDAEMTGTSLAASLLGFNLGVEMGQLALVTIVLPCLFLLSRFTWYRRIVVQGGSLVLGVLGAYWVVDRVIAG